MLYEPFQQLCNFFLVLYEAEQRLSGTVMDVLTGPRDCCVEMTVESDLLLDYVFVSKRVKQKQKQRFESAAKQRPRRRENTFG